MTSQTVEEKTLTNKLSLVPFCFSLFSLPSALYITSCSILSFPFSPSAYVDPYSLVLVS